MWIREGWGEVLSSKNAENYFLNLINIKPIVTMEHQVAYVLYILILCFFCPRSTTLNGVNNGLMQGEVGGRREGQKGNEYGFGSGDHGVFWRYKLGPERLVCVSRGPEPNPPLIPALLLLLLTAPNGESN